MLFTSDAAKIQANGHQNKSSNESDDDDEKEGRMKRRPSYVEMMNSLPQ